ncbi:arginase family protein [Erwinia sorbitola]|uniref:Arginase family protein n=1 Tax=Erwinia sorbitola TaxID=2681984 RepID=A0A6I6EMR7_9GAMM|nr:arginase family protein [Erwinia sorbitola]QGU85892.1 arginase family protein [Erwinia sorbitola]
MSKLKTIRLVMPQWQGGNNPAYHFGAQLLAWLAPAANCPVISIPVTPPENNPLSDEGGIVGRRQVIAQLKRAQSAIQLHSPDKIAVLGGDCLVDLAPFAYLAGKYQQGLGILWIDAHPDVMTPAEFSHSHAHVLGALMGHGDAELTAAVTRPISGGKVMIAGLNDPTAYETDFIQQHAINTCSPDEIKAGSRPVLDWIENEKITHLAVHFDLDVLNFRKFRSVLFANPDSDEKTFDGIGKGTLEIDDVISLINQVNNVSTIVGLGIAEHLPWDAINMKRMLASLPLISD